MEEFQSNLYDELEDITDRLVKLRFLLAEQKYEDEIERVSSKRVLLLKMQDITMTAYISILNTHIDLIEEEKEDAST